MNFSAVENSDAEKKQKYGNFFSRFYTSSRILVIILSALVITAISIVFWFKSSNYKVLYDHLSNKMQLDVVNQLNQMQIPYKIVANSQQLLVPSDKIDDLRLYFSKNNFIHDDNIGFELLDKERFGISQFNEKINYQRALEGELARTIQKIHAIKSARIHIALSESSLFLQDKKAPSAAVILDVKPEQSLNANQINAILHFIAGSISDLSTKNITIVDQFGRFLNDGSIEYIDSNNLQLKYVKGIEENYTNRIQNILEPLVGIGNVHSQVTAQIDFNPQESTQEQYVPKVNHQNQSMLSGHNSFHDKIDDYNVHKKIPGALSNSTDHTNHMNHQDDLHFDNIGNDNKSNINHENTVNDKLIHIVSHTKKRAGEIKRLSAAVVVNLRKDKNGKLVVLSGHQMHHIRNLVRQSIGYSHVRGDSFYVVNASFSPNNTMVPVQSNDVELLQSSNIIFFIMLCVIIVLFIVFLLFKYVFPMLQNTDHNIKEIKKIDDINKMSNIKAMKNDYTDNISTLSISSENFQKDLNIDQLLHQIGNISNQNPRTIALIIRQWMSNKI